ncbi:hypothetical protein C900_00941 [Fulvivirga imtechensis AK7]|uniref:Permease n=1 Tax=Fulvivirga imtechensis AK7 TaxID=1237149 RepID=L8JH08_9BACT|nr:AI-2E family transporter [Fulvivirga imtechensis]ELR68115.1 hypothetical protein C900_00941 [Fulvivirga imtechensis AK7]
MATAPSGGKIRHFISRLVIVIIALALVMLLYHGARYFLLLFTGALMAILWRGIARWIERKTKLKFKMALPFVILLNIGAIVVFVWLASPSIAEQVDRLSQEIPKVVDRVESQLQNSDLGRRILNTVNAGEEELPSGQLKRAFTVFSGTMNFLIDILLIIAFSLFLAAGPHLYTKGVLYMTPNQYQDTVRDLFSRMNNTLFRWFIGKIVDMFSIFVMSIIGLWLLDMPLIFTFALIAFFFSFVPNIGPVLSAVPPVAIAFLDSSQKALYVGLLYLGIQLIESYFVTPNVQKHASYVPPVLLLLVQFLLAKFLGVLGLFLSTPILVMVMVLVQKLYVEERLGNYELEGRG